MIDKTAYGSQYRATREGSPDFIYSPKLGPL